MNIDVFQCSSASRKFLNPPFHKPSDLIDQRVSVLFSEPKIPQYNPTNTPAPHPRGFSALQRAENSSIRCTQAGMHKRVSFSALQRAENSSIYVQDSASGTLYICFSALQRAENSSINASSSNFASICCFSALQRAENSSIDGSSIGYVSTYAFQCSSASRKFLNRRAALRGRAAR